MPRPSCCCWSPAALIVMHRAHTNTQVFCELHARFLSMTQKYKAFISTGFQTSADIVIVYMRSIVCWAAQCTSGALSAAVVAANFRDYISSTKMTTLLNSRAVFLSASSLLLLLPALLPPFLSFLSSLPTGSPRTSIIFPACSSFPHLT